MNGAKIDAFGFPESATLMHGNIIDAANHIGIAVQRCAALLRSLNYQLLNVTGKEQVSMIDIQALVELALLALPDPEGDHFDQLDRCDREASQTFKAMRNHQQTIAALLDAIEIAARKGSTLDEITAAANAAYSIVTGLSDGQRRWDVFCELIVSRGLAVEMVELGPGFAPHPKIHTPETLKHSKAMQRKTATFVAAVHEEAAARASSHKPAKQRQGSV